MTEVGKEREPALAFTSSAVSLFCTMNCARSPTIFELGVTCTQIWNWCLRYIPVLRIRIRIRIHRIHVFLGLLDPDPLVRGMDTAPDPSILRQI
jgi:hypothetical protein